MRRNSPPAIFILIAVSFFLTSCSIIFSGKMQKVHINTQPNNAKIFLDDSYVGNSPRTIEVRKKLEKTNISIRKEGYVDTTFKLEKKFDKVALLSTFYIWIDFLVGPALKYKNEFYHLDIKARDSIFKTNYNNRKSMFFIVKSDSDTIFTQPFIKLNSGFSTGLVKNIEYKELSGVIQKIDAGIVRKFKTQAKDVILNGPDKIGDNYKDYVNTYLNVPYYQKGDYVLGAFMLEFLENNKYHLVWTTIDTDFISDDGTPKNLVSGNYYLYEEGKSLLKLDYTNTKKVIPKYFSNYPELIKELNENPTKFSLWNYTFTRRYDP